jgi:3-oxoacyl-[acyl-carrier-protein] synthase-3
MLYIHGMGHYHPENIIDNDFLTALNIGSDSQWVLDRVGISERRTALSLDYIRKTYNENPAAAAKHMHTSCAQSGAKAAQMALERAQLSPEDIGMVIAGSCAPQYLIPANACVIANELGIQAPAFDINSGCSTFVVHLHTINQMLAETSSDFCLLLIPEHWTWTVDYRDRKTAILVGDCAVATIVSKKILSNMRVSHTTITSDPAGWNKVLTPTGQHFHQDGPSVQRFAIKKTLSTIKKLREMMDCNVSDHYFIGHQANLLMLQTVCQYAEIQENKHLYNVREYGNTGAASAPSVLSQHWHHFKLGDRIALAVVGTGLTWGGAVIEYGY